MSPNLKIAQVNLNSCFDALNHLVDNWNQPGSYLNNIDIACIQELPNNYTAFPDFEFFLPDTEDNNRNKYKVAIARPKSSSLNIVQIPQKQTKYFVLLKINSFYLLNCYIPQLASEKWEDALKTLEEIILDYSSEKLIICLDSNCHHTSFGYHVNEMNAVRFLKIIENYFLQIINTTKITSYSEKGEYRDVTKGNAIDFTLHNHKVKIINWDTHHDNLNTDHATITFEVVMRREKELVFNYHKVDMNEVSNRAQKLHHEIETMISESEDLDQCFDHFHQELATAQSDLVPQLPKKKHVAPYMNRELKMLRNRVKNAQAAVRKKKKELNIMISEEGKRSMQKQVDAAILEVEKEKGYLRKKHEIERVKYYQEVVKDSKVFNQMLNCVKTRTTELPSEEEVKGFYDATFLQLPEPEQQFILKTPTKDIDHHVDSEDLKAAWKKVKKSAAGPDGIKYNFIRKTRIYFFPILFLLVQQVFKLRKYPQIYKDSRITIIPKPNVTDPSVPFHKRHRAIVVANKLSQVLDRVILQKLNDAIKLPKLANLTVDEIHHKINHFLNHDNDNKTKYKFAIFFDIEAAFNTTSFQPILNQLMKLGIDRQLYDLMFDYFQNRRNIMKMKDDSEIVEKAWDNKRGVFQGTSLATYLWNIFMLCVKEKLDEHFADIELYWYVDDLVFLFQGNNLATRKKGEKSVSTLLDIAQQLGFVIQERKTVFLQFGLGRNFFKKRGTHQTHVIDIKKHNFSIQSSNKTLS